MAMNASAARSGSTGASRVVVRQADLRNRGAGRRMPHHRRQWPSWPGARGRSRLPQRRLLDQRDHQRQEQQGDAAQHQARSSRRTRPSQPRPARAAWRAEHHQDRSDQPALSTAPNGRRASPARPRAASGRARRRRGARSAQRAMARPRRHRRLPGRDGHDRLQQRRQPALDCGTTRPRPAEAQPIQDLHEICRRRRARRLGSQGGGVSISTMSRTAARCRAATVSSNWCARTRRNEAIRPCVSSSQVALRADALGLDLRWLRRVSAPGATAQGGQLLLQAREPQLARRR